MRGELIELMAFAIQDESLTRLQARRYARAALSVLRPGDLIGPDMMVVSRSAARKSKPVAPAVRLTPLPDAGRLAGGLGASPE